MGLAFLIGRSRVSSSTTAPIQTDQKVVIQKVVVPEVVLPKVVINNDTPKKSKSTKFKQSNILV